MFITTQNVEKNARNAELYFFQLFLISKKHSTLANSNNANLKLKE